MKGKKCIVKDCTNRTTQGKFIGNLCLPCAVYVKTMKPGYSQMERNVKTLLEKAKRKKV